MTRRILQILIWLIAAAILAIALVLVVSAGRLWLEYGDPDPGRKGDPDDAEQEA